MKLVKIVIVLCVLLGLTGCTSKDNEDLVEVDEVLLGESDHWTVEYKVDGYYKFYDDNGTLRIEGDGNQELIVTYKGTLEELASMRTIEIEYPHGDSSHTRSDPPESIVFSHKSSVNIGTLINVHDGKSIDITVTWDGDNGSTETITIE
ncbi:MAG: hypothetical protein PF505_07615 [Vallitaleaceae bacterium]|jgi:hypothetical protein|nr:hypothetical protein [Vallitaleaceae bacterium]